MRTRPAQARFRRARLSAAIAAALAASAASPLLAAPTIDVDWLPSSISAGGNSQLYFFITNPDATPMTGGALATITYPGDLTNTGTVFTNTCSGSGVTILAGGNTISFDTVSLPAAPASCSIGVLVTGSTGGTYSVTIPSGAFSASTGSNFSAVTTAPALTIVDPYQVTNTNDSGAGSLRSVIAYANTNCPTAPSPTISFNIPGPGPFVISPATPLPSFSCGSTYNPTVNGYTQPGAAVNTLGAGFNASTPVVLDGTTAGGCGLSHFDYSFGGFLNVLGLDIRNFGTGLCGHLNVYGNRIHNNGVGVSPESGSQIGDTSAGERNVIGGNSSYGIEVAYGGNITIAGNYIGTVDSGMAANGNGKGIFTVCSSSLSIYYNVISGNGTNGVSLSGDSNSGFNTNKIGVGPDGTTAVPNGANGVLFDPTDCGGSNGVELDGNIIARNVQNGVFLPAGGSYSTGIRIVFNSIYGNGTKNINLDFTGGPLPNDAGDTDTGPNNRQNYPVITSAAQYPGYVIVDFTLDSTPAQGFEIHGYCNSAPGIPAGETYVGSMGVTAGTGPTAFSQLLSAATCPYVSLLAEHGGNGDTSEFSPIFAVTAAPTPAVSVSSSALNFGNVAIGTTSQTLSSIFTSTGTLPWDLYYIGSPSCYGGPICYGGAEFICSTTCTTGAAPVAEKVPIEKSYSTGQTCSFSASFAPTFTGPQSATVQFCGNTSPLTITLSGNGVVPPPLVLSPANLSFGTVPVGSSVGAVTFTLTNPGATSVGINSISTTGPFFVGTHNCGSTLLPNTSCSVGVSFTAPSAGLQAGTLDVATASGATLTAMLSGTGTIQPELLLPPALEFAQVLGSTDPSEQVVSIQNTGLAPLSITSIAVTGANFTLFHDCPATLAPGGRCLARIRLNATEPGTYNGALTIVSNAPGGSGIIPLHGIAQPRPVPILEVTPREIGFGNRAIGTVTAGQRIEVKNVGGAPANLTRFDTGPDFLILSNGCGASLQSLTTCEAMVAMRPVGYGTRYGAFTVTSNAENSPNATTLNGTGCRVGGFLFGRSGASSSCGP